MLGGSAGGGPAGHADDAQHEHPGERLVPVLRVAPCQPVGEVRRTAGVGVALPPQLGAHPPQARPVVAVPVLDQQRGSRVRLEVSLPLQSRSTPSASPGRRARPRSRRRPPRTRRAPHRRPARRAPCTGSRGRARRAGAAASSPDNLMASMIPRRSRAPTPIGPCADELLSSAAAAGRGTRKLPSRPRRLVVADPRTHRGGCLMKLAALPAQLP